MDSYLFWKLLHILSSTLLFGTGLGTAFYMWRADKSSDIATIATVSRNVVLADWLFTTPAVILQPLTGVILMQIRGYSFSETWLWGTIILYVIAGACWLPVVWLQIQMRNAAQNAINSNEPLPPSYHQHMRFWFWLGWPAFCAVVIIFYLMVYRP